MLKDNDIIRTVADELFELVKKAKRISVEDAAKQLKVPITTIQTLVDFLVEEKVFGIEYKFTTPYIYLYRDSLQQAKSKDKSFTKGLVTKEQFYDKAKQKKVPYEIIEGLWRKYLQQNLTLLRAEFLRKAKEKNVSDEKTEELWEKYLVYL
ncbi:MAG: hypothetical protein AABX32_05515 [Nanoarchaeota archaeon]